MTHVSSSETWPLQGNTEAGAKLNTIRLKLRYSSKNNGPSLCMHAYIHIYACTAANLHNALKASKRSVKALFFSLQNLFSYVLSLLPRLVTAVTAPGLCFVCPIHILCLDSHEGGNTKIPIYKNLQRKKHLSWNLSSDALWGGRIPR